MLSTTCLAFLAGPFWRLLAEDLALGACSAHQKLSHCLKVLLVTSRVPGPSLSLQAAGEQANFSAQQCREVP